MTKFNIGDKVTPNEVYFGKQTDPTERKMYSGKIFEVIGGKGEYTPWLPVRMSEKATDIGYFYEEELDLVVSPSNAKETRIAFLRTAIETIREQRKVLNKTEDDFYQELYLLTRGI